MTRSVVFLLLLTLSVFVVACDRGEYDTKVDSEPRYGFDATSAPTVDRESVTVGNPPAQQAVVLDEAHDEYVPPPLERPAVNQENRFVGKDAVRFWIWNKRGSAQLLLAEGETAMISSLDQTVRVDSIGVSSRGETVLLVLNGEPLPLTHEREEVRLGDTYIFISEILLNEAQEPTCTGDDCALTTQCATSKEGVYCFGES